MEQLTDYIVALANLYGLVSIEQVVDIYNSQNESSLSVKNLEKELEEISEDLKKNFIYIDGKLFVHEAIYLEDETPQELFDERQNWPYYEPEKEELLRYVDEHYFEKNVTYKKIEAHLTSYLLDGDARLAEEITTEIHDQLNTSFNDIEGALEAVAYFGVSLDQSERVRELLGLMSEYAVNIRLWEQNGYSLQEMTEQLRSQGNAGKPSLEELFQKATLLEKYIVSLSHLYGRVTKEKVVEVYNAQNVKGTTVQAVENYLTDPPAFFERVLVFVDYNEFLSEDLFLFEDAYEQMVEAQKGKPFYIPDQNELFLYFDTNYSDQPKEFGKLVAYLQKNLYKGNHTKARVKADFMFLAIEMGDGLHDAFYVLKQDDYVFNDDQQLHELTKILKRLNNNTRMRENNRLTPKELSRIEKEQKVNKISISRNAPCYCGSGKKYKKCCLQQD